MPKRAAVFQPSAAVRQACGKRSSAKSAAHRFSRAWASSCSSRVPSSCATSAVPVRTAASACPAASSVSASPLSAGTVPAPASWRIRRYWRDSVNEASMRPRYLATRRWSSVWHMRRRNGQSGRSRAFASAIAASAAAASPAFACTVAEAPRQRYNKPASAPASTAARAAARPTRTTRSARAGSCEPRQVQIAKQTSARSAGGASLSSKASHGSSSDCNSRCMLNGSTEISAQPSRSVPSVSPVFTARSNAARPLPKSGRRASMRASRLLDSVL